jgi:Flp pilus assembly protein TadB
VSKERAARRAEREAERVRRVELARARERRAARRRGLLGRGRPRRGRADSVLARRRRRQNLALLAALLVVNALLWVVVADWGQRAVAAALSLLLWPLLTVLVFDRRPSS